MIERERSCYKCGYFGSTSATVCPQCRSILHTATSTRVRGGLLVLIGVILMSMMGYLLIWALAAFRNTSTSGARFTGTEQEKLMIVALFSTLILFGFMSLVTGGWQLIFGRRNRTLAWSVLGLGALLAIGTGAILWIFD